MRWSWLEKSCETPAKIQARAAVFWGLDWTWSVRFHARSCGCRQEASFPHHVQLSILVHIWWVSQPLKACPTSLLQSFLVWRLACWHAVLFLLKIIQPFAFQVKFKIVNITSLSFRIVWLDSEVSLTKFKLISVHSLLYSSLLWKAKIFVKKFFFKFDLMYNIKNLFLSNGNPCEEGSQEMLEGWKDHNNGTVERTNEDRNQGESEWHCAVCRKAQVKWWWETLRPCFPSSWN